MEAPAPPLIVLDTSVVVSALVGPPGSPHDRLIDKVASGDVLLALSDDFLRELSRVMGNLRSTPRNDWPSIRDPKDGWMLDLVWNVYADCIVSRDPHLTRATMPFPVEVLEPHQLLERLPA